MTWQKLKEKIEDHIVTIVLSLVTFLCVAIWQAVPTETWAQLGAVIPKRALAALIGLLLIALATSIAYIFSLRRGQRPLQNEITDLKNQIPKIQESASELFLRLESVEHEKQLLQKEVKELSYQLEFDETIDKILLFLTRGSGEYPSTVARHLELHSTRVEFFLGELEKQKYVQKLGSSHYILSQRGKEYLVKKSLV